MEKSTNNEIQRQLAKYTVSLELQLAVIYASNLSVDYFLQNGLNNYLNSRKFKKPYEK